MKTSKLQAAINRATEESRKELARLQKLRTKANKSRKLYWQSKIDTHFGLK